MISRIHITIAVAGALASHYIPCALRWRDDRNHRPLIRTPERLRSLGACAGQSQVYLSSDALRRSEEAARTRLPGSVRLSYVTTQCDGIKEGTRYMDDSNSTQPRKGHVLLVHGTGMSSAAYTDGIFEEDNDPTLWEILRDRGYDITAIDLRGHGTSEITDGPYSVELLGADLASFVRTKFPEEKVHCHGLSVGFGVCMSMAVYDSDILHTLSGSGFLFDRTNKDFIARIFSSEPVVRAFGMRGLGLIGDSALKVSRPGICSRSMQYTHMDGYVHTSAGWLNFNLKWALPKLMVPTLIMLPEFDNDVGNTRALIDDEVSKMPSTIAEIVEFPGHSHVMLGEKDGTNKIGKTLLSFLDRQAQL